MSDRPRLIQETREALGRFSTTTLSDALDRFNVKGAVHGLKPLISGKTIIGQAVTLLYLPVGITGATAGDFLHLVEPGDVIVIDNRARTDCTVWGGILSEAAKKQGIAGTVIDGATRDSAVTIGHDYPMWCRATHMLTGKDRVMLQAINVPVTLGHVRVDAGDVIAADEDGVVSIPFSLVDKVIEAATHIDRVESLIVEDIRSGMKLLAAREKHKYFDLQKSIPS